MAIRHWCLVPLLSLFGILYGSSLNAYGMFWWDEAEYASIGRAVFDGRGFELSGVANPLRPPVLPLVGAVSIFISGDRFNDFNLKIASALLALFAITVVYSFGAAAFDSATAFSAAFLFGISPFFWLSMPRFLSEIPFMAFFSAAVWCFHFGIYRHQRCFYWSWGWIGVAFLTRYTATLFLPVVFALTALAWVSGDAGIRSRLRSRAYMLSPLAAVLVVSPWFIREYLAFGDPFAGLRIASTQLKVYAPNLSMPWYYYGAHLPWMFSPLTTMLFAAGAVCAFRRRQLFILNSCTTVAVIMIWFSMYRYKEERLISSALPFMAGPAAYALNVFSSRLRLPARTAFVTVVLAGAFFLNFRAAWPILQQETTAGYPCFLDAMAFLRAHARDGAVVLGANDPQIHWYSGLRARRLPATESAFSESLGESDWVVITNFEPSQPSYMPRLLLDAGDGPRDSISVFRSDPYVSVVIRSGWLMGRLHSR